MKEQIGNKVSGPGERMLQFRSRETTEERRRRRRRRRTANGNVKM